MSKIFLETEPLTNQGRYEIKMVYDGLQFNIVRSLVLSHSQAFKKTYPPRQVNNVYFDSEDLELMIAHVQGSYQRYKIRLRWYHPTWTIRSGNLEIKTKTGSLGHKEVHPVPVKLDLKNKSWNQIQSSFHSALEPNLQHLIKSSTPILINHYQREYYQNANRTIRVTLDRDLHVLDQRFGSIPNLSRFMPARNTAILEIKAHARHHEQVAEVLDKFPAYCSAYSKYIQAAENMSF